MSSSNTVGLSAHNWRLLEAALEGYATLVDASDLVTLLRRDKSAKEIEYHRKAAALSDDGLDAAIELTHEGAFEGDILAAMQGAVFKGGGDYAGNEFIIGSGPAALLCRYQSGRRHLQSPDQMTLEWAGAYCRYHAAMMRTLLVGKANDTQKRMHAACVEALEACEAAVRPGDPMGNVFEAHAKVFDTHGYADARMNACGYGMGAIYNPIWVDFPMFYKGNSLIMNAGNVYFLHMILMDSDTGYAMCWGPFGAGDRQWHRTAQPFFTRSGREHMTRRAAHLIKRNTPVRTAKRLESLLDIEQPVLQAPMAGASGPDMAIAASRAGALGSLPCAMLDLQTAATQLSRVRAEGVGAINLNFFCHQPARGRRKKGRLAGAPHWTATMTSSVSPRIRRSHKRIALRSMRPGVSWSRNTGQRS